MRVHQELPAQLPQENTVLAIGVFDGVHIGHQRLLNQLKNTALQGNMLSGVLTFVIIKAIDRMMGIRVSPDEEGQGLDIALHDERGFNL